MWLHIETESDLNLILCKGKKREQLNAFNGRLKLRMAEMSIFNDQLSKLFCQTYQIQVDYTKLDSHIFAINQ